MRTIFSQLGSKEVGKQIGGDAALLCRLQRTTTFAGGARRVLGGSRGASGVALRSRSRRIRSQGRSRSDSRSKFICCEWFAPLDFCLLLLYQFDFCRPRLFRRRLFFCQRAHIVSRPWSRS